MSEGFAYIDILFFAMVAAFIALRLRSVLGRRTGQERRRSGGFMGPSRAEGAADGKGGSDNVVALPDRSAAAPDAIADLADGRVKTGLTQIRLADPGFDLTRFLAGARAAFEMIVHAYAIGDKEALRPLLADGVFAGFSGAIDQRRAAGQTLDTQLMAIEQAEVVDGRPVAAAQSAPTREAMAELERLLATAGRPFAILGGGGWTETGVAAMARFLAAHDLPAACGFRRGQIPYRGAYFLRK